MLHLFVRAFAALVVYGQALSMHAQVFQFEALQPGIPFVHNARGNAVGYLPCLMGSGLTLVDFDNDGREDAYLLNGFDLEQNEKFPNALYRNLGSWEFLAVENAAILGGKRLALGACSADVDNDGFEDIIVSCLGGVEFLINNGDGTFDEVSRSNGIHEGDVSFGAGIVLLDFDHDGDLDLFVGDYVDFSMEQFAVMKAASFPYPPGPEAFPDRTDKLFENTGSGNFRNVSGRLSSEPLPSPSMGAIAIDANDDGWMDVLVCSDAMPNLLYMNQTDGTFEEEAFLYGIATNATGIPIGSMGATAGDIDGDGSEDVYITSYSGQNPVVFKGLGGDGFQDVTLAWRAGNGLFQHANWGAEIADFDNSGVAGLFVANGHLFPKANEVEQMTAFEVQDAFFRWGGAAFSPEVANWTAGLTTASSRGCAVADFDNDGFLDLLISSNDEKVQLLRNCLSETTDNSIARNWLRIELVGTQTNRDGSGAMVTLESGGKRWSQRVRTGQGYQSGGTSVLHFGIGQIELIDRIVIQWGDHSQELNHIACNHHLIIVEE